MRTLILAEHDGTALNGATARALTAARAIGAPVDLLVAGNDIAPVAEAAARLAGAEKVLKADHPGFAHPLATPLADLLVHLAPAYSHILSPATSTGKDVLPRVAALLDVPQISEAIVIHGPKQFDRPIHAGAAIQTVETDAKTIVATVRASAFPPAEEGGNAPVEAIDYAPAESGVTLVSRALANASGPELATARVVVSGGRALGSAEAFTSVLQPLADKLGAALGATRAAVDAGYAPNDWQVGQTGKTVQPDLYIAVGISGAVQHLSGMKTAKTIVAIDTDPEAPIFSVADYGLVGDLFEIVPELVKAL